MFDRKQTLSEMSKIKAFHFRDVELRADTNEASNLMFLQSRYTIYSGTP